MIRRLLRVLGRGRGHNCVGRRAEREPRLEIEAYLELRARELQHRGVPPDEARRRAEAAFGDTGGVVAQCRRIAERRARRRTWRERLESLPADVRFAIRVLAARPFVSTTAVLTLALGIGASTALFTVVDAVLLRPLPYPQPERLARIFEASPTTPEFPVAPGRVPSVSRLPISRLSGCTTYGFLRRAKAGRDHGRPFVTAPSS